MANEITTTTLDDLTQSYLIEPIVIYALSERPGIAMRMTREFDYRNKATNAVQIPTETSFWGSANDRGAGVDTEYNATMATALSNTAYSSGNVTLTAAEYGVASALVDNVVEDTVDGLDVLMLFKNRMLHVLGLALDSDYVSQFPNLSNNYGTTNTAPTVANMLNAQQGIRTRGTNADALAYVLGNQTATYIESALSTTSTSMAVYALSADRLINYAPTSDNGMGPNRQVMTFRGYPVIASGLTLTANATVDEVSACVCPTTAYNDGSGATTHGCIWKRLPTFETQRQAKLRATDLVMSARWGVGELQDGSGSSITTKAT
jgi:hypothetical protein